MASALSLLSAARTALTAAAQALLIGSWVQPAQLQPYLRPALPIALPVPAALLTADAAKQSAAAAVVLGARRAVAARPQVQPGAWRWHRPYPPDPDWTQTLAASLLLPALLLADAPG